MDCGDSVGRTRVRPVPRGMRLRAVRRAEWRLAVCGRGSEGPGRLFRYQGPEATGGTVGFVETLLDGFH